MKRLTRLTNLLLQLQVGRMVTAQEKRLRSAICCTAQVKTYRCFCTIRSLEQQLCNRNLLKLPEQMFRTMVSNFESKKVVYGIQSRQPCSEALYPGNGDGG